LNNAFNNQKAATTEALLKGLLPKNNKTQSKVAMEQPRARTAAG